MIGDKLSKILKERRKSVRWLAEQSGITEEQLYTYLVNRHNPRKGNLFKLSSALQVEPEDLQNDSDSVSYKIKVLKSGDINFVPIKKLDQIVSSSMTLSEPGPPTYREDCLMVTTPGDHIYAIQMHDPDMLEMFKGYRFIVCDDQDLVLKSGKFYIFYDRKEKSIIIRKYNLMDFEHEQFPLLISDKGPSPYDAKRYKTIARATEKINMAKKI